MSSERRTMNEQAQPAGAQPVSFTAHCSLFIIILLGISLGCGDAPAPAQPNAPISKATSKTHADTPKSQPANKPSVSQRPRTAAQRRAQELAERERELAEMLAEELGAPSTKPGKTTGGNAAPDEDDSVPELSSTPDPRERAPSGEARAAVDRSARSGIDPNRPSKPPVFSPIDEAKVREAGIRKLEGERVTIYTDLPSDPEIDELPEAFDQAFEQWCKYFGIKPRLHPKWKMRASLIEDKKKFEEVGLIPPDLPKFLTGYTRGHECWLYTQTSPYYRRHLLLHEGVHGLMFTLLGGNAPPWYIEGMAELLATHRWENGVLEAPYFPKSSAEVPKLGRIDIIQNDFAKRQAKNLADVFAYDGKAHLNVEPYGWSWGAAAFLDGHPRYRDRFRTLQNHLTGLEDFNEQVRQAYTDDARLLAEEWQVFVADLVYGYDFGRTAIDFTPGKPIDGKQTRTLVHADRGWQNTGIRLEAGKKYQLTASGRYQLAKEPKPWISEPGGVSIRYHQGKPLGILLAAVRPDVEGGNQDKKLLTPFLKPITVGTGTTISPEETGTLYFKINESPAEFADNSGRAEVEIVEE